MKFLEKVGRTLYGLAWQSDMARGLGVSDRTIRRWHADGTRMPRAVINELEDLARIRRGEIETLIAALAALGRDVKPGPEPEREPEPEVDQDEDPYSGPDMR